MKQLPQPYYLPLIEIKSLLQTGKDHYTLEQWMPSSPLQHILLELIEDAPECELGYTALDLRTKSFGLRKEYLEAKGILSSEVALINEFLAEHAISDSPIVIQKVDRPNAMYAALFCAFKFLFLAKAEPCSYDINNTECVPLGASIRSAVYENTRFLFCLMECEQGMAALVKPKSGRLELESYEAFLGILKELLIEDPNLSPVSRDAEVFYPIVNFQASLPPTLLSNIYGTPSPPLPKVDIIQFAYNSEVKLDEHGITVKGVGGMSMAPRSFPEDTFKIDDNFVFFLLEKGKPVGAGYVQKEHFVKEKPGN